MKLRLITCLGAVLALLVTTANAGAAAKLTGTVYKITQNPRWQGCGSKASPSPPCCQKGCCTAGLIVRS